MITNKDIGKHKNIKCAEFGFGTINISEIYERDTNTYGLIFNNQKKNEIINYAGLTTDDIPAPEITFYFNNKSSIDILINFLTEIKNKINEKNID